MSDFSEATPRPWNVKVMASGAHSLTPTVYIVGDSSVVAETYDETDAADAALIVEAVNSYDNLTAEVRSLRNYGVVAQERIEALEAENAELQRQMNDWREGDLAGVMAHWNATKAENARLREALENIDAVGVDFGHYESAARTMQEYARAALKGTAE